MSACPLLFVRRPLLTLATTLLLTTLAPAPAAEPPATLFVTDTIGGVGSIAFHPARPEMALANDKYALRLISSGDGSLLRHLPAPQMVFYSLAFNPQGTALAGGSFGTIYFWDPRTGRNLNQIKGDFGNVRALAFSPDGQWLATSSSDHYVRLFDARTLKHQYSLTLDGAKAFSLSFSPDSQRLAAPSGMRVYLWKVGEREAPKVLGGHRGVVTTVCFAEGGTRLFSGDLTGTLAVWDTETAKPLKAHRDHEGGILTMATDRGGYLVAVAGKDRAISLRDGKDGTVVQRITNLYREPLTIDLSPDGQRLAAGFRLPGNAFQLWKLDRTALVAQPPDPTPRVSGAEALPDEVSAFLDTLNQARTDPAAIAEALSGWRARYDGLTRIDEDGTRIKTREGVSALDEAITFLKAAEPLPPFALAPELCRAAETAGGTLAERIRTHGRYQSEASELIIALSTNALASVAQLIIDDGQAQRPRRQLLFYRSYQVLGLHLLTDPRGASLRLILTDKFNPEP